MVGGAKLHLTRAPGLLPDGEISWETIPMTRGERTVYGKNEAARAMRKAESPRHDPAVDSDIGDAAVPPHGGDLAGFLPYQLSIASNAVSAVIAQRYRARFALKIPEWRVMAVLGDSAAAQTGPEAAAAMTQRALGKATLMDKVAVSRACKVLEDRGLIARVPNSEDGRSHLMALTAEGWAIHEEVMPLARLTESELFAGFAPEEREALRTMLSRLRVRAGELGEGAL